MELVVKQELTVQQAFDYKHKKFDARSKRIRYDSNSSTESSTTSTMASSTKEFTVRNSETPLSCFSDYKNFQPGCNNKRNWTTSTPEASKQPAFKRRRLLKEETHDSGFLFSTPQTYDNNRLTPAPPRFTSTPLSALATGTATKTRRHKHIFETNDSGLSMTHLKVEDDAASVTSTSTGLSAAFPRYTSTPLAVLAAVAATTPLPKSTPPTAVNMPKISDETMHNICKYHGNMVRKFPKKERTPKDQERRNKNTIACRMSRRLKKLENVAIEEQYKEFNKQHFEIVEASMRAAAYLNALTMKLAAVNGNVMRSSTNADSPLKVPASEPSTSSTGRRQPKPFSIEYLTGKISSS